MKLLSSKYHKVDIGAMAKVVECTDADVDFSYEELGPLKQRFDTFKFPCGCRVVHVHSVLESAPPDAGLWNVHPCEKHKGGKKSAIGIEIPWERIDR